MINAVSLIWGVVTLCLAVICLIPFLGWGNWFVIPMALIGIVIGALSARRGGMILNIVALILAFFRLIFGGGIL
jgi:hypothetical protein